MTEAQRIGQLFMVGLADDRLDAPLRTAITTYHFGSVWYTVRTTAGVEAVRAVSDAVQALATSGATDGVGFIVAANQEGGLVQALAGPGFDRIPSALDQGALASAELEAAAVRWGQQLRAAGVELDFAPVADVVPPGTDAENAPIGQLEREYGHDPTSVAAHIEGFIDGLRKAGVAATVKHFPGLGRVVGNTDFTASVIDATTTSDDPYLLPFGRASDDGVPFVMVSLATYERIDPGALAAFSPTIIRGVLRGRLGFEGVVMSDSLTAEAVAAIPPGTRAIRFIEAGGDMIVANQLAPAIAMAKALAAEVAGSPTFGRQVDDAALLVLQAKDEAGLLPCGH